MIVSKGVFVKKSLGAPWDRSYPFQVFAGDEKVPILCEGLGTLPSQIPQEVTKISCDNVDFSEKPFVERCVCIADMLLEHVVCERKMKSIQFPDISHGEKVELRSFLEEKFFQKMITLVAVGCKVSVAPEPALDASFYQKLLVEKSEENELFARRSSHKGVVDDVYRSSNYLSLYERIIAQYFLEKGLESPSVPEVWKEKSMTYLHEVVSDYHPSILRKLGIIFPK
ncbi:MAG TPA: hypothetical protein VGZ00_07790 [Candidatus Baltobacteraceae bacterium]|jgi:hypothetical protein|nr:hypothetical protein [Candidatus Baltobacteraceae bacterium]